MKWLEVSVEAEAAAVETVSAILREHGEGGVALYQHVVPDGEDGAYHYDTARPTTVTTYVPATADGDLRRERIATALGHLTAFDLAYIGPVQARTVDEEDWANAWKRFYHPMRFGHRLVVTPSWHSYVAQGDDVVIEIDPGMAFGTGLHQTTALCLGLLEDYVTRGALVLDQGTGSGILAIAAVRLGAARVVAIDTSEVAVAVARENAARNGLDEAITVLYGDAVPVAPRSGAQREEEATAPSRIPDLPTQYDVVVANIIADVIITLAPHLAAVRSTDGVLIASGIIREREGDVRAALAAVGLTPERREVRDEWVALVARGQ